MANNVSATNDKIIDIQLLRGLSILLVLGDHSWFIQAVRGNTCLFPGWIGVNLFFVISGFVVVRSFENSRFDVASFVIRRLFRLYPSILVVLGAVLLLNLAQPANGPFWFKAPEAALIDQSWAILLAMFPSDSGVSYTTGPYWTLVVEMRFYAGLALAVGIGTLVCREVRQVKTILAVVAGAAYAYLTALRFALFLGIGGISTYWLADKFDFLALGVLLGLCRDDHLRRVAARTGGLWPIFLGAPLVVVAMSRSPGTPAGPSGDLLESVIMIATGWSFLLLVAAASQGMIVKRCSPRIAAVAQWIGDRSFLIYILHMTCFVLCWYALHAIRRQNTDQPLIWILQPFMTAAIMYPLVVVLHRFVEAPGIRWGSRLARRIARRPRRKVFTLDPIASPQPAA